MAKWIPIGLVAALALAGCASTERSATPTRSSGFLGTDTYSRLQSHSGGDTAARSYVNRTADLRRYNRIILQPVQMWRIPGDREQLTAEQRQLVTNAFYAALRRELEKDFQIVDQPGPTTMVVAAAVTQARAGGNPVLASVSTFVPQARLAREGVSLLTGSDPMTGGAAGELKITDSVTGELLGAAVDSRDATAGTRVRTSSWDDVQAVTTYWAQLVRYRLCVVQQRPGCQVPGASS